MRATMVIGLSGLLAACGGSVETSANASGGTGAGGSGSTTSTTSSTSTTSTTTTTTTSGDCAALVSAIAANMKGPEACTATVRLDYTSKAILGFAVACAPYAAVDETKARATAQADTGQGQSGQAIASPPPADEWVFWQSAGDFGGSAAVAARNGISVFGGTTIWGGKGDITYPKAWQPPSAIGVGCAVGELPTPPGRGFDLGSGQKLSDADVNAALAVAWNTALPAGLSQGGYLFEPMVLLYPRTVGAVDPSTAEWIVLVNSGWLE